jgi:hypothetical protein
MDFRQFAQKFRNSLIIPHGNFYMMRALLHRVSFEIDGGFGITVKGTENEKH